MDLGGETQIRVTKILKIHFKNKLDNDVNIYLNSKFHSDINPAFYPLKSLYNVFFK